MQIVRKLAGKDATVFNDKKQSVWALCLTKILCKVRK